MAESTGADAAAADARVAVERAFSEPAAAAGVLHPRTAAPMLRPLLGVAFEDPAVARFSARFPHLPLSRDAERGTVRVTLGASSAPGPLGAFR